MPTNTIAIGSDHAGVALKAELRALLQSQGLTVIDYGAIDASAPCAYPDVAQKVTAAIVAGECARGILICGTGLGMSYAANRRRGIRAALCWSREVARLAREHNDSNVLVLPARAATVDPVAEIMQTWLNTVFSGAERHRERIEKIEADAGR